MKDFRKLFLYNEPVDISFGRSLKCYIALLLLVPVFLIPGRVAAADYYWVGGSGNWSDLLHWATTSGGTTYHIQAPTANDNVIFDVNSFDAPGQIVTINSQDAFCLDMDWTQARYNPSFTGISTAKFLHIHGSLRLTNAMQWLYDGIIRMVPSVASVSELDPAGIRFPGDIHFSGDGDLKLLSALVVDKQIFIDNGTVSFSGQQVEADYLLIDPVDGVNLRWDNASIILHGTDYPDQGWHYPFMLYAEKLKALQGEPDFILDGTEASFYIRDKIQKAKPWSLGQISFSNASGRGYFRNTGVDVVVLTDLSFSGDAYIYGNNDMQRLKVTAGHSLSFSAGTKQNLERLEAVGDCQKPIQILTDRPGKEVLLSSTSAVSVDYCNLRDIHARGDFTATNSTNLGNNAGWKIMGRTPTDLYWVGGTGNWSDPAHWSDASGGPGGFCVPTGVDNVFFDAKSFTAPGQSVTIDQPGAQCHNMDWTGVTSNPSFKGNAGNIYIFGSLYFSTGMQLLYEGVFVFASDSSGEVIRSSGQQFHNDISFTGSGSWTLLDALESFHALRLYSGSFITNDQAVTIEHFYAESQKPRSVMLGASKLSLRHNNSGGGVLNFRLNASMLNWDAGTSLIEFVNNQGLMLVSGKGKVQMYHVIFNKIGRTQCYVNANLDIQHLLFTEEGFLIGYQHLDSLIFNAGYRYRFRDGYTYAIDYLEAKGSCDKGMTYIDTDLPGMSAQWKLSADILGLERLFVKDIHASGAVLYCTGSADGGNNQGWNFGNAQGRVLYWVGGDGQWNERQHWSLQSGGTGGECLPTALDDVIFDANSGFQPGDLVRSNTENLLEVCHDFIVRDVRNRPRLTLNRIVCYGSVRVRDLLDANALISLLELNGEATNLELDIRSPFINILQLRANGRRTLRSDISVKYSVSVNGGSFIAEGKKITVPYCFIKKINKKAPGIVSLKDSKIILTGVDQGSNYTFHISDYDVRVKGAVFRFLKGKTSLVVNRDSAFTPKQILFEDPEGIGIIQIFHTRNLIGKCYFYGDGEIRGSLEFDSLICSAGKAYKLQSKVTQKVNRYLSILGNNCFPIRFSSLTAGAQSIVQMDSSGEIIADFIQMRDQKAEGTANFFAGTHSTDIGMTNTNWIFDASPDKAQFGILGENLKLCEGEMLRITGNGFNDLYKYKWNTGDTSKSITVDRGGTYWVEVQFQPGCIVKDSIDVELLAIPELEHQRDTTLCEGDSLLLDVTSRLTDVRYHWSDGVDTSRRVIKSPGWYKISLDHLGCVATDSFMLSFDSIPLGFVRSIVDACAGDTLILSALDSADRYLWNTGAQTRSIHVKQEGDYILMLQRGVCSATDTIGVRFHTPLITPLRDTAVCEGTPVKIGFEEDHSDLEYLWDTRDTGAVIKVDKPGVYHVVVTDSFRCSLEDSMRVRWRAIPVLKGFAGDTAICEGAVLGLKLQTDADKVRWADDGSSSLQKSFDMEGEYTLVLEKQGCTRRDSFGLTVNEIPELRLSGDSVICPRRGIDINIEYDVGNLYWEDGVPDNPRHISHGGKYRVIVDNEGCLNSAEFILKEMECSDFKVYVPNVFTPNHDGINELFEPEIPSDMKVVQYEMKIWDRWGEQLFESRDFSKQWGGRFKSMSALPGVYVWRMQIVLEDSFGEQKPLEANGTVTLLR